MNLTIFVGVIAVLYVFLLFLLAWGLSAGLVNLLSESKCGYTALVWLFIAHHGVF